MNGWTRCSRHKKWTGLLGPGRGGGGGYRNHINGRRRMNEWENKWMKREDEGFYATRLSRCSGNATHNEIKLNSNASETNLGHRIYGHTQLIGNVPNPPPHPHHTRISSFFCSNQPVTSTNQSICQTTEQLNQSINQTVCWSLRQSISRTSSQLVN